MKKFQCRTIQMKATELDFPMVLFTMLCKVVLTFESSLPIFLSVSIILNDV